MRITEMLQDYQGSASISRAVPALVIVWILAMVSYATFKAGALIDIPPGWREVFLASLAPYLVSKAREALDALGSMKGATDAAQ